MLTKWKIIFASKQKMATVHRHCHNSMLYKLTVDWKTKTNKTHCGVHASHLKSEWTHFMDMLQSEYMLAKSPTSIHTVRQQQNVWTDASLPDQQPAPFQATFSSSVLSLSNETGSSTERPLVGGHSAVHHTFFCFFSSFLFWNCFLDKTEAWTIATFTVNDFAHTNSILSCIVCVLHSCLVGLRVNYYC